MMSFAPKRRMGWLPDYPDFRDYTEDTEAIQDLLHPESAPASGRAATAATLAFPCTCTLNKKARHSLRDL